MKTTHGKLTMILLIAVLIRITSYNVCYTKLLRTHGKLTMILLIAVLMGLSSGSALAEKPIVVGCPLSTAFLYGWDAERGVTLAIEEINAQGGANVAGKKRPFKT